GCEVEPDAAGAMEQEVVDVVLLLLPVLSLNLSVIS
ncbi:hypothetical protein A2U01_0102953, partial [Trifolium medium]|nr:hypothetical protein [Trifolium medium]